jgi:predicted RNA binding protein YcfA (HicA-like mRNA interferase family)
MGKLPFLKPREVEANLRALGFVHVRTKGSHKIYVRAADGVRKKAIVPVDMGHAQFSANLMKNMIRESLFSQEEFCSGQIKKPALALIPVPEMSPEPQLQTALEPVTEEDEDA